MLRPRLPPRRAEQSQPSQSDCSPFTAVKFTLAAHDSGEARTRIPPHGPVSLRRPRILLRWQPLETWRSTAGTESTRSTPGRWCAVPAQMAASPGADTDVAYWDPVTYLIASTCASTAKAPASAMSHIFVVVAAARGPAAAALKPASLNPTASVAYKEAEGILPSSHMRAW